MGRDESRRTIVIVGCGRMGGAFARAWQATHRVLVHDPAAATPEGCETLPDPADAPADALVLLAVKPQGLADVARHLARVLTPAAPVVSIAAGVTLAGLGALLGRERPMVRAMPNTPVAIGLGMTAAVASASVSADLREAVAGLFGETGSFVWLDDEAQMDVVTALSGSGPAYFFRFAEALAAAGRARGLPPAIALELARATLGGAGGLAAPGADLAALREAVTSPGGTTAAALAAFADGGIDALADAAVAAAVTRAGELSATV